MGRPSLPKNQKRVKRTIRVEPALFEWIQEQVRTRRFKDETHAFEYAVARLMAEDDSKRSR